MVVDDRHAVAFFQQLRVLDLLGPVGVHDHEERPPVGKLPGLFGAYEGGLVGLLLLHALDQAAAGVMLQIHGDAAAHAVLPGDAADARRRADRVQIRKAVAHDQHLGGIAHQLGQGIGHDAGLDLGAFLHLQPAPAEELEAQAVLDHHLVAAAGERQLRRLVGKLQPLAEGVALLAEADADGGGDAVGALDLVHLLDDGEALLLHALQILLLEDREVAVSVVAAEDALAALAPLAQPLLRRVAQLVAHALGLVAAQLVQIVKDDDPGYRTALLETGADLVGVRYVHPVGDPAVSVFVPLVAADQVAVQLVFPAADVQQRGILLPPLQQPFAGEAGD